MLFGMMSVVGTINRVLDGHSHCRLLANMVERLWVAVPGGSTTNYFGQSCSYSYLVVVWPVLAMVFRHTSLLILLDCRIMIFTGHVQFNSPSQ